MERDESAILLKQYQKRCATLIEFKCVNDDTGFDVLTTVNQDCAWTRIEKKNLPRVEYFSETYEN